MRCRCIARAVLPCLNKAMTLRWFCKHCQRGGNIGLQPTDESVDALNDRILAAHSELKNRMGGTPFVYLDLAGWNGQLTHSPESFLFRLTYKPMDGWIPQFMVVHVQ
jgi:hypothetical protein